MTSQEEKRNKIKRIHKIMMIVNSIMFVFYMYTLFWFSHTMGEHPEWWYWPNMIVLSFALFGSLFLIIHHASKGFDNDRF